MTTSHLPTVTSTVATHPPWVTTLAGDHPSGTITRPSTGSHRVAGEDSRHEGAGSHRTEILTGSEVDHLISRRMDRLLDHLMIGEEFI